MVSITTNLSIILDSFIIYYSVVNFLLLLVITILLFIYCIFVSFFYLLFVLFLYFLFLSFFCKELQWKYGNNAYFVLFLSLWYFAWVYFSMNTSWVIGQKFESQKHGNKGNKVRKSMMTNSNFQTFLGKHFYWL